MSGIKKFWKRFTKGSTDGERVKEREMQERQANAHTNEEEGRRLALQDRPRLDKEIEEWAAGISSEELELWVSEDLTMWPTTWRWHEEDMVDMKEVAKVILEKEFDELIIGYHPQIYASVELGASPGVVEIRYAKTQGGRYAMEASLSSPLLSALIAGDKSVDVSNVEFFREEYNDSYVVEGRLRKMKELYMQVMVKMGLFESVSEPEEAETVVEEDEEREATSEKEANRLALQDHLKLDAYLEEWAVGIESRVRAQQWVKKDLEWWQSSRGLAEKNMKEVAEHMLSNDFDDTMDGYDPQKCIAVEQGADPGEVEYSYASTKGGSFAMEASCSSPLLSAAMRGDESIDWYDVDFQREINDDIYVVTGRLGRMKELYMRVMVEMGLMEPESEPEEAEKDVEAQAPSDRGIEWVRGAFLNKLETLDIDIGIDFFIIEEIGEGMILVKGKGYMERPIWGALNDMVRSELGGRYDSSQRGWVV